MAQWLNKCVFVFLIFSFQNFFSQLEKNVFNYNDLKDPKQFEKFQKRRKIIAAWQINQLKEGALVIKLKTNKILIDELIKNGNTSKAQAKKLETFIINKNIIMAYKDNFNFCKIYFIYSYSYDSLLRGVRSGIFLDTNLMIDPTIEMKGNFYLVGEKDYIYNSSIGFIKEDSARFVREQGNPSGQQAEVVIKNKYGHQLKKPFPYVGGYGTRGAALDLPFVKAVPSYYYETDGQINYVINKTQLADFKASANKEFKKAPKGAMTFLLEKEYVYEILSLKIARFNDDLIDFYKGSPKPQIDKPGADILPFLY
jgi:hypothetical protein